MRVQNAGPERKPPAAPSPDDPAWLAGFDAAVDFALECAERGEARDAVAVGAEAGQIVRDLMSGPRPRRIGDLPLSASAIARAREERPELSEADLYRYARAREYMEAAVRYGKDAAARLVRSYAALASVKRRGAASARGRGHSRGPRRAHRPSGASARAAAPPSSDAPPGPPDAAPSRRLTEIGPEGSAPDAGRRVP